MENRFFRYVTWACAPLQVAMVIGAAYVVTHRPMTLVEIVGFVLSVGISSGAMGINVSHEMIHRIDNRLEPYLGRVMLATVGYMHWGLEHVKGAPQERGHATGPGHGPPGTVVLRFLAADRERGLEECLGN